MGNATGRGARRGIWLVGLALACGCVAVGDDAVTGMEEQAATTGPPGTWLSLIATRGSYWQTYDGGTQPPADWTQPLAGGAWPWYYAPIGYGENYLNSHISYGPSASQKYPTAYFRHGLVVEPGIRALYLRVLYDDGFVFHLNGHEGGRANMPAGPVGFDTLALPAGHEAGERYVTFDISAQIPHLRPGEPNAIAFEVHQSSRSSSDLVFDAEVVAWRDGPVDTTTSEGVQPGSLWHFWDRGAPPSGWQSGATDHSGWSAGPSMLGFGDDYIMTPITAGPITTYFEHRFTSLGSVTGIHADVVYDDGFVFYLNGHEISRASMPAGPVADGTLASDHESFGLGTPFDWSSAVPYLVRGDNTLAVEVHQASTASSDLVFGLNLELRGAWQQQVINADSHLLGVWSTDAQHVWAVGTEGAIVRTSDGGATWIEQPSGTTGSLHAIQFTDAQRGFIVGDAGTVLATTDGGATWSPRPAPTTETLFDLSFVSATTGWVVGAGRGVFRTDDGGATWTPQPVGAGSGGAVTAVDFLDGSQGFVAMTIPLPSSGEPNAIHHTGDGGASYSPVFSSTPAASMIQGIEAVSPTTIWAVGWDSRLSEVGERMVVSRDGGATWQELPASTNDAPLADIQFLPTDPSLGWAVGNAGSILHTSDGGATWQVQEVARYYLASGNLPRPSKKPLYAVHFADPLNGWAVGERGTILHTSTGGK
jgi:photosystem II stability/assembly factor-like uncharacterized protein